MRQTLNTDDSKYPDIYSFLIYLLFNFNARDLYKYTYYLIFMIWYAECVPAWIGTGIFLSKELKLLSMWHVAAFQCAAVYTHVYSWIA